MRITEARLRRIIRDELLEGRADFERATQDIKYSSDFEDPLFASPESKKNIEPARKVKQAWSAAVDMHEPDETERRKASRARRWLQGLTKVTWMSYEGNILEHLKKFLHNTDRRGDISVALSLPGKPVERHAHWGWLGVEVDGRVTLAAGDMQSLMTGFIGGVPPEQHEKFRSSGTPRKPTVFNQRLGRDYIFGPEDAGKLEMGIDEDRVNRPEGLVANWKPKKIVIDTRGALSDLVGEEIISGVNIINPFFEEMRKLSSRGMPIVDTDGDPIDLDSLESKVRESIRYQGGSRFSESRLRNIIRRELLREGPFDDFISPSDPPVTPSYKKQPDYKQYPSIAHPLTRSKEQKYEGEKYIDVVKDLMRNTKDNWVIITPNDVRDRARLGTDEFNEWLRSEKLRRPDRIFAFAASMPLPGDENAPQWAVVHDLLGHTLDEFWQRHGGRRREKAISEPAIISQLHSVLPTKYRMSYDPGDMTSDVLAGILLGALKYDHAREVVAKKFQDEHSADEITEALELVDHMFRDVDAWLKKARAEGFVVLAPW